MEYELYADIWFLTNLVMDCIALGLAGKIMKQRIYIKRLLLAACWGTAGSIGFFLLLHKFLYYQILVHILVNPLMVWLCFRARKLKQFVCQWTLTYLSVILLGGSLEWSVSNLTGIRYFLPCLLSAIVFLWIAEKILEYFRREKETVYDLLLVTAEGTIAAKGFFDTGNLLVDPLVGKPVHIIKKKILEEQIEKGKLLIRMIPFHSLGTENGIMEAVTIEGMYILKEGQPLYLEKPVLGLAEERLFRDDGCGVILNGKSL
ncbi:MAG: sigma-E processing peptidase SpoIIGA [Lachnospiraceae bacterium]|nr:sigma-E processing peptidase SpoIIGA [Lachnospiraceae bacterium]